MNAKQAIFNFLAIGLIVVFPHAGLIPLFGYSLPILLVVWLALKYSKETFSDIGFRFKDFPAKALVVGPLIAAVTLVFMQWVFFPILEPLVPWEYDDNGLTETLQESPIQLAMMIFFAWLIGGFYEEWVFHGFMLTRLEKFFNSATSNEHQSSDTSIETSHPNKWATILAFVLTAILFGFYHIQLGMLGVINALLVGMVYAGLFLYYKRNLWYSIIAHGSYNTMVMVLIYFEIL